MPNAFTKYSGSMYSSSPTIGNWDAFLTQDLVKYVDQHYRTLAKPESRGLAGHSMGGYGTLRIGMKYPGIFSSLYAMSPCCLGREHRADARQHGARRQSEHRARISRPPTSAPRPCWPPRPPGRRTRAIRRSFFDLPMVDGKPVPQVIAEWAANAPLAMVDQYCRA